MPSRARTRAHVCPWNTSVALDVGATFSGYCIIQHCACERHPEDDVIICRAKFPTRLLMNRITKAFTFVGPNAPPLAARGTYQKFENFKLALVAEGHWNPADGDVNPALVEFLRRCLENLETSIRSSKLVSHYLKGLWALAKTELEEEEARTHRARGELNVVITYPHYWDTCGVAKGRFEEAIELAEIKGSDDSSPILLTEHKAAVWSVAHDLQVMPEPSVEAGDPVIVIDCGGINIDVIAINCPSIEAGPDMAEPLGARYILDGSVVMDFNFDRLLTKLLERETGKPEEDWTPVIYGNKKAALADWQRKKHSFVVKTLAPDSFSYIVEGRTCAIHRDDMLSIFEPTSQAIVNAIVDLYRRPECNGPKAIFMTGGLSLSPQIQQMVVDGLIGELGAQHPTVQVRDDDHIWNAVQHGAAQYGMSLLEA